MKPPDEPGKKNILGIPIITDPDMPEDCMVLMNTAIVHRQCPACRGMRPFQEFTDRVNGVVRDICAACRKRADKSFWMYKPYTDIDVS